MGFFSAGLTPRQRQHCVMSRQASPPPAMSLFLLLLLEQLHDFFLPFLLAFSFPYSGLSHSQKELLLHRAVILCWAMLSNNALACVCTGSVRSSSCSNKCCIWVFPRLPSHPVPDLFGIPTLCTLWFEQTRILLGFECCLSHHYVQRGQSFTPCGGEAAGCCPIDIQPNQRSLVWLLMLDW